MLIVSVVGDHSVRRIRHEGALKPLDELTLEARGVSRSLKQTVFNLVDVMGKTYIERSCGVIMISI